MAVTVHYTLPPPTETTDLPSVEQLVDFYTRLKNEAVIPGWPGHDASVCPGCRSVAVAHFRYGWPVALIEIRAGNVRWDTNAFVPKEWHDRIDEAKRRIDLATGAYPKEAA